MFGPANQIRKEGVCVTWLSSRIPTTHLHDCLHFLHFHSPCMITGRTNYQLLYLQSNLKWPTSLDTQPLHSTAPGAHMYVIICILLLRISSLPSPSTSTTPYFMLYVYMFLSSNSRIIFWGSIQHSNEDFADMRNWFKLCVWLCVNIQLVAVGK